MATLATMQPGRVVCRYSFYLQSGSLGYADSRVHVEGEAEELRQPDEWGEPGAVVSRRWLWVRDGRGHSHIDRLDRMRIEGLHAPRQPTWADFDMDG